MDTLSLGGFTFDGYSTPNGMTGGGRQAMVMHKLPGGARVIDTLGPDEANVNWSGFFYGNDSYSNALIIDGMRASGLVIPLIWGNQLRSVIIENFTYTVRKFPVWVEYHISLVVYQNPALGILNFVPSTIDTLVITDLNTALGL